MRTCKVCKTVQPEENFGWTTAAHTHRRHECNGCARKRKETEWEQKRSYWSEHDPYVEHETGEKRCSACKEIKPITSFSIDRIRLDGLQGTCAPCQVKRGQQARYGRSIQRGDSCWICGSVDELVVDHDHSSLRTRDVLCRDCNLLLGYAHDDVDRLLRAAEYLNIHTLTEGGIVQNEQVRYDERGHIDYPHHDGELVGCCATDEEDDE